MTAKRDVFTTGNVGQICRVASATAKRWIDNGFLKGFRIPGGSDRRVSRESLVAFMAEHGMPAEWLSEWESES